MRLTNFLVLFAVFSMFLFACSPDVVVPTVTLGTPSVNAGGSVQLPTTVTVKNIGDGSAGVFKAAIHYQSPEGGPFVVRYTVPGQTDTWYPHTSGSLGENEDETFVGVVTFIPQVHNVTVDVWAEGDSCAGDEFMPVHCRVDESNETNNNSTPVSVALP